METTLFRYRFMLLKSEAQVELNRIDRDFCEYALTDSQYHILEDACCWIQPSL